MDLCLCVCVAWWGSYSSVTVLCVWLVLRRRTHCKRHIVKLLIEQQSLNPVSLYWSGYVKPYILICLMFFCQEGPVKTVFHTHT